MEAETIVSDRFDKNHVDELLISMFLEFTSYILK